MPSKSVRKFTTEQKVAILRRHLAAVSLGFTQGAGTTGSVDATLPIHPILGLSARVATNLSLYLAGDPSLTLAWRPQIGLRVGHDVGNVQWDPELQVGTEGAYLCLTWRWGTAPVRFHDASDG